MKSLLLVIIPFSLFGQNFTAAEISHWQQQARHVNIIRDQWGIPHIYGMTDADAVFGLLYAQCEDDFPRVELNYIEKLGRMAELQGVAALPGDLLNRLLIDSADAISDYQRAPRWLRRLCNAFADGINYYIYTHPQQKRLLLSRFEPWYPLLWTDGSIGAINTADIRMNEWASLYLGDETKSYTYYKAPAEVADPGGSNGFAFSPKITASGNAILYINPHVTFYFRPEVHMVSEEGLNAYGAVTWGQFFIYQGFNEHCGWMHTSSYADAADSYIEKLSPNENGFTYLYEGRQLLVREKSIVLKYKSAAGIQKKTVNALYTDHGPIMAQRNGAYLSLRADNRLLNGLIQCWQRTKARNFEEYKKTMALFGNISNNTVYADADGNIAYWHGNRIPRRDTSYDWSKPVDGSIAATQWKGLHSVEETVHLYNPSNGWLQN
ncbi:MAG TPA: penicillin acylase family protein, partial [Chitinophagaceae bacterium]|nr:penicillin acylase family protein [Chitinophagaceae bacterium]